MSPQEQFLQQNKQNMFTCTEHFNPCRISYVECAKRYAIAERHRHSNRGTGMVYQNGGGSYDYQHYLGCKIGKQNAAMMKQRTVK